MNLIIPAAGASSRFPNVRPKWMLTHPNGNMMVYEAIRGLDLTRFNKIFLVVLKEHLETYRCREGIKKQFQDVGLDQKLEIIVLPAATRSQPETVAKAIELAGITGPIVIKDSDNFFRCDLIPENFVAVSDLNQSDHINPRNKSYVMVDDKGLLKNIIEKQVISPFFCVGAYGFAQANDFLTYFKKFEKPELLYISHIIHAMLLDNHFFCVKPAQSYLDWGTLKDWRHYKSQFGTIFIDLDGVLVLSSSEHFEPKWGTTQGIPENIAVLNQLYDSGKVQIIITTSRKSAYQKITEEQLKQHGVKYHRILYELYHAKRVIVNDYSKTNPFRSCAAVNLRRNDTSLKEMLEDALATILE